MDLTAGGVTHAARFEDLIFQRSAQPFSVGAEISDGTTTLKFITTIRHIAERHALGVEAFDLSEGQRRIVSLRVVRPEDIGDPSGAFLAKIGDDNADHEVRIQMVGLFPAYIDGELSVTLKIAQRRDLFEEAFSYPSYLGPFRLDREHSPEPHAKA